MNSHTAVFRLTCVVAGLFCISFTAGVARAEGSKAEANSSIMIGDVPVSLMPLSMKDGLGTDAQNTILKTAAGKYSLDRFIRDSIVAPFTLQRETIRNTDGQRVGHRVDLWFVAHGRLDAIENKELLAAVFGTIDSEEHGVGDRIADAELAARGIKGQASAKDDPTSAVAFHQFSLPVLDRVVVEGVVRETVSINSESRTAGIELAEAFRGDAEYPNQWRKVKKDDGSRAVPYTGYAAYAKATKLAEYDDAILVECHAVVHEPYEWFDGANLLGSKLPIAVQDAVRRFRRKLAKRS